MEKILGCIIALATVVPGLARAAAIPPRVYFSDIISGPSTGNSDTSLGQTAGQDGAIVSIWGGNFGSSSDSVQVFCGGVQAPFIYYRGNAAPPYSPANLNNGYTNTQMIIFQVSHLAQSGLGDIHVVVNGATSNTLPFTVTPGNIYFVKTTGSDTTGNGSWTSPWGTLDKGKNTMAAGDVVYIGDGVSHPATLALNSNGSSGLPKMLVAYPGASVTIGSLSQEALYIWNTVPDTGQDSVYWTIAKFNLVGANTPVPIFDGFRIVANHITAPNGQGATGTLANGGSCAAPADNLYVLGNEMTSCGSISASKLYHVIYISGARCSSPPRAPTEYNRQLGWNYLHDNYATNAINIYTEGTYSAYIQGHRVNDNVIVNQNGEGIMMESVTGENWIYNNLISHTGWGPLACSTCTDPAQSWNHSGLELSAGNATYPSTGTILYVYNNTVYGSGEPLAGLSADATIGQLDIWNTSLYTFYLKNNSFISIIAGVPYLTPESDPIVASTMAVSSNNLWFGAGAVPSWDSAAINANPQFVSAGSNFRLQSGSPAVDSGASSVASVAATDVDGTPRPQGAAFDIGAYEYCASGACSGGSGTIVNALPPARPRGLRLQ